MKSNISEKTKERYVLELIWDYLIEPVPEGFPTYSYIFCLLSHKNSCFFFDISDHVYV